MDPKRGKQCLGVPLPVPPSQRNPSSQRNPLTRSTANATSQDDPSGAMTSTEFVEVLAALQRQEERYSEELRRRDERISELESDISELRERQTKIPSTPPGTVDISRGPQGLRVRGPAGYALAVAALLFGAVLLWQLKTIWPK